MNDPIDLAAAVIDPASADVIDLSMNEGEPPGRECLDVLEELGPAVFRKYEGAEQLEEAYAAYLGTDPSRVLATTGADDAIDRVFRAFLAPEQDAVFPTPTFIMVPAFARMAGGRLVPIEYEWGTLPHDRILDAVTGKTGVVVVISPDNPTGMAFPTDALVRLAGELPAEVTLMVDMAYAEFAESDPTEVLLDIPTVVMIRTMSKSWGLAGLRVGFAVGSKERIDTLRGYGGPYSLSGPSIAIAVDRLHRGVESMREFVEYVTSRRERLAALIRSAGGMPLSSQTNFVSALFPDAVWIRQGMAAQGILVRCFDHLPGFVRTTVPRDDGEFRRVERAMQCLKKPEALIFDMDGVLADVRRSYRRAIVQACASFGVTIGNEEINAVKARGHANDDWAVTRTLLTEAGVRASPAEVTRRFEEAYQGTGEAPGLRRHETLIPAPELIEELARAFKLGIVTGRPRKDAERFLREMGIRGFFGAVICREDGPLKPDPAPVTMAVARLKANTAWMMGDTPDDVCAAKAARLVPVGVVPPGGDGSEAAGGGIRRALLAAGAARVVDGNSNFGGLFDG
ncbi:MAG: aminotransferase class I/II-fold pyridoxal phosphate-dependent enzyme [Gemmatimonadetes bacterium]|nr:aminotransferase class I/II-fold pyridoxal phosphate-dependent enzyme [Gemmatimonadota bacterium]